MQLGIIHHNYSAGNQRSKFYQQQPLWFRMLKHSLLLFMLLGYIIIGGVVFYFIEKPTTANNTTKIYNEARKSLQDAIRNHTGPSSEIVLNELQNYDSIVNTMIKLQQRHEWTLWNSWLYAFTICTTIGKIFHFLFYYARVFSPKIRNKNHWTRRGNKLWDAKQETHR